jgi:hypothetical protein
MRPWIQSPKTKDGKLHIVNDFSQFTALLWFPYIKIKRFAFTDLLAPTFVVE